MKRKLTIGTLVLVMVLLATTLAGCSIGMDSKEEIIEKNELYAQITYYSSEGYFGEESSKIFIRDLYYKEDSKALNITDTTSVKINHKEDILMAWNVIKTLEQDGETYFVCDVEAEKIGTYSIEGRVTIVLKDNQYVIKKDDYDALVQLENKPNLVVLEAFDFKSHVLAKGEKIYLLAEWAPNQKVEYVLLTEGCSEITLENGTKCQDRTTVASVLFDSKGEYTIPTDYTILPVKATDATFVDYYVYSENVDVNNLTRLGADGTKKLTRPADESNIKIFVKYVSGTNWTVVRVAQDVKAMFSASSNKFYVSRDIDCSQEATYKFSTSGVYRATIAGNGHTITGVKIQNANAISTGGVSLFGNIAKEAKIENITFNDLTFTCTTKPSLSTSFINVYLLAHSLRDEGQYPTFTNVKFGGEQGLKVHVTLENNVSIENIPSGAGGYDTTKWLIKDKPNDEVATSSVELINFELKIGDEVVLSK